MFHGAELHGLAFQISEQVIDCPTQHLELMQQEVGEVCVVGLDVHEGPAVLGRRRPEQGRDRDELGEPIALPQQSPVEQCSGGLTIPIHKRVDVCQVEVKSDGPDHGVYEGLLAGSAGPLDQLIEWASICSAGGGRWNTTLRSRGWPVRSITEYLVS